MDWYPIAGGYLALVSLVAFALMGADKRAARQHRRRIPERTLFLFPLLGGTPGAIVGMFLFHHKTRHWYFRLGLPALLVVQVAAGWLLWRRWGLPGPF